MGRNNDTVSTEENAGLNPQKGFIYESRSTKKPPCSLPKLWKYDL